MHVQLLASVDEASRTRLLACLRLQDELLANCAMDTMRCAPHDTSQPHVHVQMPRFDPHMYIHLAPHGALLTRGPACRWPLRESVRVGTCCKLHLSLLLQCKPVELCDS